MDLKVNVTSDNAEPLLLELLKWGNTAAIPSEDEVKTLSGEIENIYLAIRQHISFDLACGFWTALAPGSLWDEFAMHVTPKAAKEVADWFNRNNDADTIGEELIRVATIFASKYNYFPKSVFKLRFPMNKELEQYVNDNE